MSNPFQWRDKTSEFAKDSHFNGHYSGISKRTSAAADKKPFIPLGSINSDKLRPADKTAKIRRGALTSQGSRGMTDQELEAHIDALGLLMVAAYNRYETSGCFADRGEADAWRMKMEAAIASRSPEQVALMESERALT